MSAETETPAADDDHPLNQVRRHHGWKVASMLGRIAAQHQALGHGTLCARPEKWSRWTRPTDPVIPSLTTQLAIAAVVGVPSRDVHSRGWPHWLLLALHGSHPAWEAPWTTTGTIDALEHTAVGCPMHRRGFVITSGSTLAAVLAQWALADPATAAATSGTRVGAAVADACDARLAALRRLDDELGACPVYDAALGELRLLGTILRTCSYTTATARRLFACAAEASRLAGWCAADSGAPATAETHYATALRAAACAGDRATGAITVGFWANAHYTNGDPRSALDLIDDAIRRTPPDASPRVLAMLHIRRARAHSLQGEPTAAYRAIDTAFAVYEHGVPTDQDQPSMYWMCAGEIFQAAGSAALSLGDPHRALTYFDTAYTHPDPYRPDLEHRGAAIYAARRAEAYLALGDYDAAVAAAHDAHTHMAGVTSERSTATHATLLDRLTRYRSQPPVRTFLEAVST